MPDVKTSTTVDDRHHTCLRSSLRLAFAFATAVVLCTSGCASLLNPATGIPVNRIPPEFMGEPKSNFTTIDLSLLGQKQPEKYLLAPNDVLGIWIEGVLGERGQLPPVQISPTGQTAPAFGYPVPIRSDGTLPLPLVEPVVVAGMSIEEAEQAISEAYTTVRGTLINVDLQRNEITVQFRTAGAEEQEVYRVSDRTHVTLDDQAASLDEVPDRASVTITFERNTDIAKTIAARSERAMRVGRVQKHILNPGRQRIIVTLMQKRTYHVLIIRQESGAATGGGGGRSGIFSNTNVLAGQKQGSGHAIDLPAYQNDVLNALAETGGLPGLDAVNEIVVQRGVFGSIDERASLRERLDSKSEDANSIRGRNEVRIPLRVRPGEKPAFAPEDVVLYSGDVVFIEARTEFFYTAGLLPSGQFNLPRDYDLDVIGAMTLVGGPMANGGFSQNNLSGTIVASGVGDISPSMLVILRQLPGGGQLPIRVDLNEAIRDPRKRRVLIQPNDILVLQQTPGEAVARYLTNVLTFNFSIARPFVRGQTSGVVGGSANLP